MYVGENSPFTLESRKEAGGGAVLPSVFPSRLGLPCMVMCHLLVGLEHPLKLSRAIFFFFLILKPWALSLSCGWGTWWELQLQARLGWSVEPACLRGC